MTNDVMEIAFEVEDLNMEPRELTLGELDDASAGFGWILVGAALGTAAFTAGYAFGQWLRRRLN
jgi:hypothetical protein